jgi:hypothetical protein
MGIPSSLSKEEILSSIELGLGSALAIFKECQIVAPEDHPDPLAINDCMNNVRDAYEDLKLYRQQLQPKQDLSKEQELIKVYDKYIEVLTDEITDLVGMVLPGWESRNVKRGEEARAAIEYAAQQLQPPGTSDAVKGYVKDLDRIIDKLFFHFTRIADKLPSNADVGAIGAVTLVELRNLRDTIKTHNK